MILKRFISLAVTAAVFCGSVSALGASDGWQQEYPWAVTGVQYCLDKKIIQGMDNGDLMLGGNLKKSEMAKMLTASFALKPLEGSTSFQNLSSHWAYQYILALENYMPKKITSFEADAYVTREEFAATLAMASGLTSGSLRNSDILSYNFDDYKQVDTEYARYVGMAVERGYLKGADNLIRPKDLLTRAEVCTLLYRVLESKAGKLTLDLGVKQSETPMTGTSQITAEQAQRWAEARGAAQIFIDIAPTYWKYGELTGLRPEILYAQAAKETGFGKYGGAVTPDMNNWAGIKKYGATGDAKDDHDSFATPDDGVRAHFNHMGAYVGIAPIGEPHGRYQSVKTLSWAGTVKNLEELGGKWCPDLYYGYSILHNYLEPMSKM